ncbi:MAG TPA: aminotransferase class I/II-fold pyridoxal phosphate-dependent enzyme [Thermomicrobiales bacterium]|nr:aminotransferase class I/II-fold pyridoxal phosphate-dependent enzyme [Thermomicrobiales bacterium]
MRGEIETRRLVREAVARLEGGAPLSLERQAEAVGLPVERLIKLDQNENPYGCSLRVQEALAAYDRFHLYPDPEQRAARERLAAYTELPAGRILLGAGTGALVDLLCRLTLDPGDEVVVAPPTRGGYRAGAALAGARVVEAPRRPDFGLDMGALERAVTTRTKLIALASPNDPTGNAASPEQLVRLLRLGPLVVLDESYVEFAQRSALPLAREFDNLVVLRSLDAWAGLAGLRVAYGVFPADLMPYLWKLAPPFGVSAAALAAVEATFDDLDHVRSAVMRIKVERGRLFRQLRKLNLLQPLPSQGNFLLCRVLRGEGRALRDRLADLGILVHWDGALPDHLRISVGRPEDTDVLLKALVTIAERL